MISFSNFIFLSVIYYHSNIPSDNIPHTFFPCQEKQQKTSLKRFFIFLFYSILTPLSYNSVYWIVTILSHLKCRLLNVCGSLMCLLICLVSSDGSGSNLYTSGLSGYLIRV